MNLLRKRPALTSCLVLSTLGWIASWWTWTEWYRQPYLRIWCAYGEVMIGYPTHPPEDGFRMEWCTFDITWVPRWDRDYVSVPLWVVPACFGAATLILARKHANPNACPACGYDRTGLPQTTTGPAPCPECGK